MDCADWARLIARRLDGTLPTHQAEALDGHLFVCTRCRAELLLQRRILEALSEEPAPTLSPDFTRRVCEIAQGTAEREKRVAAWLDLIPGLAIVITAAVLLIAGGGVLRVLTAEIGTAARHMTAPAAWLAGAVGSVFGSISNVLHVRIPGAQLLPASLSNAVLATVLAGLTALWGFYETYGFLRD